MREAAITRSRSPRTSKPRPGSQPVATTHSCSSGPASSPTHKHGNSPTRKKVASPSPFRSATSPDAPRRLADRPKRASRLGPSRCLLLADQDGYRLPSAGPDSVVRCYSAGARRRAHACEAARRADLAPQPARTASSRGEPRYEPLDRLVCVVLDLRVAEVGNDLGLVDDRSGDRLGGACVEDAALQ